MHAFPQKFVLSAAGPASMAAASFVASVLLLHAAPGAEFGLYAFVQVLITGIGYSISVAVMGSPLMVALNRSDRAPEGVAESFAFVNSVVSLTGAALLLGGLAVLGVPTPVVIAFAISAFLSWIRWFGRALGYSRHRTRLRCHVGYYLQCLSHRRHAHRLVEQQSQPLLCGCYASCCHSSGAPSTWTRHP